MRTEMTIGELKAILAKYNDNDTINLYGGEDGASVEIWKANSYESELILEAEDMRMC